MSKTSPENLHELFILKLKALYDIENQVLKSLPKMAKKAKDENLKAAFEEHEQQTKGQIERIEQAFKIVDEKPAKTAAAGIRGLVEDTEWLMKNINNEETLDAALAGSARYVEHYEMAGYISALEWADLMGHDQIVELLEQNLEEEIETEEKLGDLAEVLNEAANDMEEESE